jgi:hypothetical protein
VTVTDAGDVVISRLTALRPMRMLGDSGGWRTVDTDGLDASDRDRLWFRQDVKVVHSETFLTYASETVKAPDLATAESLFRTPLADLVEIGTDPTLVIPEP